MIYKQVYMKTMFSGALAAAKLMVFAVVISITIASIFLYKGAYMHRVEDGRVFILKPKTSATQIGIQLEKSGLIMSRHAFYALYHLHKVWSDITLQAGEYAFTPGMRLIDILNSIIQGKVVKHMVRVQEGFSMWQTLKVLEQSPSLMYIKPSVLKSFGEGSILPDTYSYIHGTDMVSILERMRNAQTTFMNAVWPKRDSRIDHLLYNKEQVLILASIVEKETSIKSEKAVIAGVYLNRLRKGMPLQADPTTIYGLTAGKSLGRKLLRSDLKHQSSYNTYVNQGLPPTPICNPGKDSILAVLQPTWTSYLFFVADGSGGHRFSNTFDGHKANIVKLKDGE